MLIRLVRVSISQNIYQGFHDAKLKGTELCECAKKSVKRPQIGRAFYSGAGGCASTWKTGEDATLRRFTCASYQQKIASRKMALKHEWCNNLISYCAVENLKHGFS